MGRIPLSLSLLFLNTLFCAGQFHKRTFKLSDTTGLAGIEARIGDFKLVLKDDSDKMATLTNLDNIKILTNIHLAIGDTLLNHISKIFDGYNTLHPDQGQAIKDICDLSENILGTKSLTKAKKYNQLIEKEYSKLVNAK